jgi:hypothetical protein
MDKKTKVWLAIIWTFIAGAISNEQSYSEFNDSLLSTFVYILYIIISMAWIGVVPISIAIWFKKKWFVIYMSLSVPLGLFWIYSSTL